MVETPCKKRQEGYLEAKRQAGKKLHKRKKQYFDKRRTGQRQMRILLFVSYLKKAARTLEKFPFIYLRYDLKKKPNKIYFPSQNSFAIKKKKKKKKKTQKREAVEANRSSS